MNLFKHKIYIIWKKRHIEDKHAPLFSAAVLLIDIGTNVVFVNSLLFDRDGSLV